MDLCTACDDGAGSIHSDPNRGHPHADGERCPWPLLGQPEIRCECQVNGKDKAVKDQKSAAATRAENKLVELLITLAPTKEAEIRGIVRDIIEAASK